MGLQYDEEVNPTDFISLMRTGQQQGLKAKGRKNLPAVEELGDTRDNTHRTPVFWIKSGRLTRAEIGGWPA